MRKAPLTPDSLMRLPEDCKRTLAEYGFCHLDEECVNLLVDLPKLREAQCTLDSPFLLNDDGQVALLCCEMREAVSTLIFKLQLNVDYNSLNPLSLAKSNRFFNRN